MLDVGCGNGDLSRVVARLAGPDGEVVGIDRSDEALASARAVPVDPALAPIRYQTADLSGALPDLGKFDAIVGRRVLMYLPDAAATLSRLAQFARPGTILAFQEHARADLPTGAGALPVHRQCYGMMWDTDRGGRRRRRARLPPGDAGARRRFRDRPSPQRRRPPPAMGGILPADTHARHAAAHDRTGPRARGRDRPGNARPRIDEERRAADGTIFWDVAFLVAGRFGHAG